MTFRNINQNDLSVGKLSISTKKSQGLPGGSDIKESARETQVQSVGWEDSLEKGMESTPVLLPEESHD